MFLTPPTFSTMSATKRTISAKVDAELADRLEAEAFADRRPIGSLVRNILEDHVMQLNPQHIAAHFEGGTRLVLAS
jgi:hypothetical protein